MARQPRSSSRRPMRPMAHNYRPTMMTLATLSMMGIKGFITNNTPQSSSYFHDLSSPSYTWLLPGWLAEERLIDNRRIYKYYYDPAGCQYRYKYELLVLWENSGFVVLDD